MAKFSVPFEIVGQVVVEADSAEEATRMVRLDECARQGELTTYRPTNLDELAATFREQHRNA